MSATVHLVRHARAGVRGTWPGSDLERPLDALGRVQADGLATALDGVATELWTSRAARCRETLAPLATATGLPLLDAPALLEGSDPAGALTWLVGLPHGAVACSHGDVLRGVLALLADVPGERADPGVAPKGGRWQLVVADGVVQSVVHHPPEA